MSISSQNNGPAAKVLGEQKNASSGAPQVPGRALIPSQTVSTPRDSSHANLATVPLTSDEIDFHAIEAENIDSSSITSRTIKDHAILSEDLAKRLTIQYLTVDHDLTVLNILGVKTASIATANLGTINLGTNTISDGTMTGNWDFGGGNLTTTGTISGSFVGGFAPSGDVDMANHIMTNIGNSGTDFNTSGGLTLANSLTVSTGGASITGNSGITGTLNVTGNLTAPNVLYSLSGTAHRITVSAGQNPTLDIASDYAGQTSIITLGTITTGTWHGSTVEMAYGGTGTTNGSITGTGALTFAAGGSNQNVTLTPSGSGYTILNGNVGIGTTVPGYKLDVYGRIGNNGYRAVYIPDQTVIGVSTTGSETGFNLGLLNYNLFIGDGGTHNTVIIGGNPIDPLSFETAGVVNGLYNTFVGMSAGLANTTGNFNTFLGSMAGQNTVNGNQNTFIGTVAGQLNTSGYRNTYVGVGAGQSSNGFLNTYIGTDNHLYATSGSYNTSVGNGAGLSSTGSYNSDFGFQALQYTTTGGSNSAFGVNSLNNDTSGSSNVAMGYYAGATLTAGSNNTFIGNQSDVTSNVAATLTNSTAIGNGVVVTKSNQVILGNGSVTETLLNGSVGIGGTPSQKLEVVNGIIQISNNYGLFGRSADGTSVNLIGVNGSNEVQIGTGNKYVGLTFSTGGANGNNMVRFTNGNVGIGTTNPLYNLDVSGTFRLSSTAPIFGSSTIIVPASGTMALGTGAVNQVVYWSGTNTLTGENYLSLSRGGTNIGTTNPGNGTLLIGNGTGYTLANLTAGTNILISNGAGTITINTNNITSGTGMTNYLPRWGTASSFSNSLIYDSGTYIGIGTTGPSYKLDINGTLGVGGTAYFGGNVGIGTTSPGEKLEIASGTILIGNQYYYKVKSSDGTVIAALGVDGSDVLRLGTGNKYSAISLNTGGANGSDMMWLSNGSVGIGTTSPNYKVDIVNTSAGTEATVIAAGNSNSNANTAAKLRLYTTTSPTSNGNGIFDIVATRQANVSGSVDANFILSPGNSAIPTSRMYIQGGSGKVGIGTTSPAYALDVIVAGTRPIARFNNGSDNTGCTLGGNGGVLTCTSDARLKKNIGDMSYGLNTLMNLRPVEYNWKSEVNASGAPKSLGFIAQDVEKILPQLVVTDANGYKELNTIGMVPLAIKAIQEQQGEITEQATQLSQTNAQLALYGSNIRDITTDLTGQDAKIRDLIATATGQDSQIQSLADLTASHTSQIQNLNATATTQDARIQNLTAQLTDQTTSTADKLLILGNNLEDLEKELAGAASETQNLKASTTNLDSRVKTLEDQMKLLQDMNQAVIDFAKVFDPKAMVYKDSLGNLDLGEGKITAKDIEALNTVKAKNIEATDTVKGDAFEMGSDTSGKALIPSGKTEVTVETPEASKDVKIYITPTGPLYGKALYLDEDNTEEGKSFKVKFDGDPASKDIHFNWLIIK